VATLAWLAYVARRPDPARFLLLGTYRPVDAIVRTHPIRTVMIADFRSTKSINILGLLEKLTGTGRPQGDAATKEWPGSAGRERPPAGSGCGSACRSGHTFVPARG